MDQFEGLGPYRPRYHYFWGLDTTMVYQLY